MFLVISLVALFITVGANSPYGQSLQAVCKLIPSTNSQVTGTLSLTQFGETVRINGIVGGLAPGAHGFHIHRDGATGNDCKDAGPHFNPGNAPHGAPGDHESRRHAGDLGNVDAGPDGLAAIDVYTNQVSLADQSPLSALGRAIVVHARPDDLGRGGDEESTKTGNAGARLACCIIARA